MAQNGLFERLARSGYVTSGLLHLIIGYLAIRIAFGSDSGDADPSGALATIAAQPGGRIALWVAAVYFAFAYSTVGFARGAGESSARASASSTTSRAGPAT